MKNLTNGQKMAILVVALIMAICAVVFGLSRCNGTHGAGNAAAPEDLSRVDAEATFTVPYVVSLTQADAEKAILASGFVVGNVTFKESNDVPLGSVVSQSPKALSTAKANTKIDLVVSSGKKEAAEVSVPNLAGLSQDDAEKALIDAGLKGVATKPEESSTETPGLVFKQSIPAGQKVKEGTKVLFTVAIAPSEVEVPDVKGRTRDEAKDILVKARLGFDYTTAYDEKVAEGKVISQSINPKSKVKAGTTVSVTVSLGAKPASNVKVPDVRTYNWTDAEKALRSAGLSARYTGDPAGTVTSQDVAPGTSVAPNTVVTVTLSSPAKTVKVPDLVGLSVTSAEIATDEAGLGLDVGGKFHGTVVDQWPAAGTEVEPRTTIHVTIDSSEFDKVTVTVPNLIGLSADDAMNKCEEAGLKIESMDGQHGIVEKQSPEAGAVVDEGSTVTISLDTSDFTDVVVPDLTGLSVTSAEMELDEIGLVLKPMGGFHGTVIDQSPEAGTKVKPGTEVAVNVDASDFEGDLEAQSVPEEEYVPEEDYEPEYLPEDAPQGNGLSVMDSINADGRSFSDPDLTYSDNFDEAVYSDGDCSVTVRKLNNTDDLHLFGHTAGYEAQWAQIHKGLEISCYGYEDGEAELIEWHVGDTAYALRVDGEGFTLSPDDITSLVSGIQ
ncbi:MAG: PASTA domain-containing protein [Coriobacteriales bacterium]|nr:PASTA domain-containing protein [Coriobacteriales bacterium]